MTRFLSHTDEQAHALHGIYVFPQLSTVTYLVDGGAPTIVLERRPDSFDGSISPLPIEAGALCRPKTGRHLVFDGRALHAAPAALTLGDAPAQRVCSRRKTQSGG